MVHAVGFRFRARSSVHEGAHAEFVLSYFKNLSNNLRFSLSIGQLPDAHHSGDPALRASTKIGSLCPTDRKDTFAAIELFFLSLHKRRSASCIHDSPI